MIRRLARARTARAVHSPRRPAAAVTRRPATRRPAGAPHGSSPVFRRSRARDPRVPCAALQPRRGAGPGARRGTAVRRDLAGAAGGPRRARSPQCRGDRPARRPSRRDRPGRQVPGCGPHVRAVALGRDAQQGPAPRALRVRAGIRASRDPCSPDPAGLLRAREAGAVRAGLRDPAPRTDHERAARGSPQAHAGIGRQLLRRDGALCRRIGWRGARAGGGDGRQRDRGRHRRRRRPSPALDAARRRAHGSRRHDVAGGRRSCADHHRRRPSSLRDGPPLSRRAAAHQLE